MIYTSQSLQVTTQEYDENYMPTTRNLEMILPTQRLMEMNVLTN